LLPPLLGAQGAEVEGPSRRVEIAVGDVRKELPHRGAWVSEPLAEGGQRGGSLLASLALGPAHGRQAPEGPGVEAPAVVRTPLQG